MGVMTFRVILYITDDQDNAITSGTHSPIAFRDGDQNLAWTEGTHINGGLWLFQLPSGYSSGWEIGVETADGTYTRDAYLSGDALTGDELGLHMVPVEEIYTE